MSKPSDAQPFTSVLFDVLDETFENHHGIYLDEGTSLFDTLDGIDAGEASRPVGGRCATLGAQVAHVIFYLEVLEDYIQGKQIEQVDWGEIWRKVNVVTEEEWAGLNQNLKLTYRGLMALLRSLDDWDNEATLEGALGIAVHSAYHLGEIRQALCILKK